MKVVRTGYLYSLVLLQFAALAYLVLTGPILASDVPTFLVQLFAILIAWSALWRMSGSRWRVVSEPHPRARLVTRGIYRRIRHPMYASLLLLGVSWLYNRYTHERGVALLVLFFVLLLKMLYEERALLKQFGKNYEVYMRRTKRLIPVIF